MSKSLIIGYGNPDREDDGVAWHILKKLAQRYGRGNSTASVETIADMDLGELEHRDDTPDLVGELQLMPEISEILAGYDRVCFVDAHTGAYAQDIHLRPISAQYQSSPFTHHLTPETCLVLTQTAYGHVPDALVLSVRGYQFGFEQALSPRTAALVDQAVDKIETWISN